MKTIFTFLLLLLISYSTRAYKNPPKDHTYFWYQENTGKTIELINYRSIVKVKGLKNDIQWVRFKRVRKNTYCDKFGNILILKPGRIVVVFHHHNRKLTFFPIDPRKNLSNENSLAKHAIINENNLLNSDHLEGSWKVEGITKLVYITNTRDGIKARFSDGTLWYAYLKNDHMTFISDEGHKYIINGQHLVWIDKTGTKKYYLSKISNEYGSVIEG